MQVLCIDVIIFNEKLWLLRFEYVGRLNGLSQKNVFEIKLEKSALMLKE